jgi:quercetin dioxygenase-like cupin family protein
LSTVVNASNLVAEYKGKPQMAKIFNESSIGTEEVADGVSVKRLITPERVQSDNVATEILELQPGAEAGFAVDATDIAWAHVLDGEAELTRETGAQPLTTDHFLFLPPGFSARLRSNGGARLFKATVPEAQRFDPGWIPSELAFRCVDWTREPVLDSEFDARKRIYLVTPKLSNTAAVKGEMILYPAGTAAVSHHHEGADHFQYILRGTATFHLNGEPHRVSAGDTVYIYENEPHYFVNDGDGEMAFIEYFVPGKFKTVWAEGAAICRWHPSGRNINGGKPSREIGVHTSMDKVSDV